MTRQWQPYRESLWATILRTGTIAVVLGAIVAPFWRGPYRWLFATLLMLWPSFGGHWVEVWFLNWLRPRLPTARRVHVTARVSVWFFGGIVLAMGMTLTAILLGEFRWVATPAWWLNGLAFIGIELAAHMVLQSRQRPNFFNGRA